MPEVDAVFAAVESRDADAMLSLFVMTAIDCAALGRSAPRECADRPAGRDLSAITVEDGGSHWLLVDESALALLRTALASGEPQPVLATVDRSSGGSSDTYYLAFSLPAFDASASEFMYASDTVGTGFGLKVVTGNSDVPIVSFSLLSADWNALKWIQMVDGEGASGHALVFPESTDGFEAMYERMGEP
ncbi:MAG: hypothetical protein CVU47_12075 [Chloroflexi bacterium HGW-Chloroflexi-9]|nr:MAG: hypothetical protein CVU47_12075 [Chloroflexi bacterium HGW-Chloroflexi-9]